MRNQLVYSVQGKGPPLVLLHPVGIDCTFWGPLVERASGLHTVISVDLMGHGASPPAPPERGITAYAADVAALLDELGFADAALLGLSFGGMIAQEFAVDRPKRLSALIVGACGPRIPAEAREAVRARGKVDPAKGMASVVDQTMQRWFTPAFMNAEPAQRVRARLLADDTAGWAAGWNAISGFDAFDRLGSIAVPTLVVAGERDAGTPVAATKAIADAIPGAEFALLPGAPHMMQIECADRFADRVMAFLRDVAGRAKA
ncbi:MAG: alpha/beta fold hydrolase [Pseudolabrys sp.]